MEKIYIEILGKQIIFDFVIGSVFRFSLALCM